MANEYYFTRDGKQYGPVSAGQLKNLADSGRLQPSDKVRKEGMANWVAAASVKGLFAVPAPDPARAAPPEAVVEAEEVVEAILVDEVEPDQEDAQTEERVGAEKPSPAPRVPTGGVPGEVMESLTAIARNPVGRLADAYTGLGKQRAMIVGIAGAVLFVVCAALCAYLLPSTAGFMSGEPVYGSGGRGSARVETPTLELKNLVKITVAAAMLPVGIFLGSLGCRKLFRSEGAWEGDLFLAGLALVPSAVWLLLATIGIRFLEIHLVLIVFAECLSILVLYAGCTRIHKMSDGAATLSVPMMILLSILIEDVMFRWILF
jgi:hypothetical protein